jgi:hypothetical protein
MGLLLAANKQATRRNQIATPNLIVIISRITLPPCLQNAIVIPVCQTIWREPSRVGQKKNHSPSLLVFFGLLFTFVSLVVLFWCFPR